MKVWQIILIIAVGVIVLFFFNKKKEPKSIPFVKNTSDSLYRVIDSLVSLKDSLETEIQTLAKNKQKAIKEYYEKDNNIRTLNATLSISLFTEWNRQLQDSGYSQRYFRISSDTVYSKLK